MVSLAWSHDRYSELKVKDTRRIVLNKKKIRIQKVWSDWFRSSPDQDAAIRSLGNIMFRKWAYGRL